MDTWKIKVQTRPVRKDLPTQRINIDVCAITSCQPRPMVLRNPYGVEMGTSGLILKAESREEIGVDKVMVFALRPSRIKNRNLRALAWLHQQGVKLAWELLTPKLKDHQCAVPNFLQLLNARKQLLTADPQVAIEFRKGMCRFLPAALVTQTAEQEAFWQFLTGLVDDLSLQAAKALNGALPTAAFLM